MKEQPDLSRVARDELTVTIAGVVEAVIGVPNDFPAAIACHCVTAGEARCRRANDLIFSVASKVNFQQDSILSAECWTPSTRSTYAADAKLWDHSVCCL